MPFGRLPDGRGSFPLCLLSGLCNPTAIGWLLTPCRTPLRSHQGGRLPPDDAYLAALQRADPSAVERLVAEYEGPLFRYFLAIHGDAALAGDQSADAFVELVRALPKMRSGPDRLRGFVYAVAKNIERRRWRQPEHPESLDTAKEVSDGRLCPADSADQQEQLGRALQAIQALAPTTRDIFVLRFVEQLSIGEVAETLGLPTGTVKSHIHRGRKELHMMLAASEENS